MSYIPGYTPNRFDITDILSNKEKNSFCPGIKATKKFLDEFGTDPKTQNDIIKFLQDHGYTRNISPEHDLKDAIYAINYLKHGCRQEGFIADIQIRLDEIKNDPKTYVLTKEYRLPILELIFC